MITQTNTSHTANNKSPVVFWAGAILGALVFVKIYGFALLNVTNDAWLLNHEDLNQHYVGWMFFRESPWSFPLGLMDGGTFPNKISITYTDSIPLGALFFKVLSPILPDKFQYFGLWGMLCFVLQGGLSSLLIYRLTSRATLSVIAGLFYILSSVLLQRMFIHTALASHWLIIAAIYLWFCGLGANWSPLRTALLWGGLLSVSAMIHPYFVPLLFPMLLVFLIQQYALDKNWWRVTVTIPTAIASVVLTLFLLGAFYGKASYGNTGLGYYSANLNALINPQSDLYFVGRQPLATQGQGEGFAYLGFGVILLAPVSLACLLLHTKKQPAPTASGALRARMATFAKTHFFALGIVAAIMMYLILALSPVITLNENVILTLKYPRPVQDILSVFRASGRFMFPVLYVVFTIIFIGIGTRMKWLSACAFAACALIVQYCDFSGRISEIHAYFTMRTPTVSTIKSPVWGELIQGKDKFNLMVNNMHEIEKFYDLANFAATNRLKLNLFYTAREDARVQSEVKRVLSDVYDGRLDPDAIYIFNQPLAMPRKEIGLYKYNLDGILVAVTTALNLDAEQAVEPISERTLSFPMNNENFLANGTITENGRRLNPGGVSFGPYIKLAPGAYRISITGSNLNLAEIDVFSNTLQKEHKTVKIIKESGRCELKFDIPESINDIEVRLHNKTSDHHIEIYDLAISETTGTQNEKYETK